MTVTKKRIYTTETALLRDCLEWLGWHPALGYYWRNNQNTAFFDPRNDRWIKRRGIGYADGTPDIIGVAPSGLFIGIECKLPGKKQSDKQIDFETMIKRYNGIYAKIHSVDELKQLFRDIGALRNIKAILDIFKTMVPIDDSNLD